MKKLEIKKYTLEIINKLKIHNLFITHLNICYKLLLLNEEDDTNLDVDEINKLVEEIYNRYVEKDKLDILDSIILEMLN
jgi:uncharacterized HAD superfamily protein